jgi:DNA-binding SARP family transcriptional activator
MACGPITRIQLCGQFAVLAGGDRVEPSLPGRRGRLLIAYLATHRRHPVGRDQLIDALWPDSAGDAAAATLTVLLSKTRALLGHDTIQGRSRLRLVLPDTTMIDVETAAAALHRAESAIALGDCRRAWSWVLAAQFTTERTFLDGYDAPWITERRAQLELIHQQALACYAQACLAIGGTELPGAERAARRLTALAPMSETGHRLLIEALAARGDISLALRTFDQVRRTLAEDLGVDPGPQLRRLHQRLLTAGRDLPPDPPRRIDG